MLTVRAGLGVVPGMRDSDATAAIKVGSAMGTGVGIAVGTDPVGPDWTTDLAVSAGIDGSLYLVQKLFGKTIAQNAATHFGL